MKISVVIPVYNEEKYLHDCLTALQHQTRKADEIIVVNNNSTDSSAQIAEKLGARVVNESKQGMIFARNRGFNEATGDVIARCDADTRVPPDWLEKIEHHFQNENI